MSANQPLIWGIFVAASGGHGKLFRVSSYGQASGLSASFRSKNSAVVPSHGRRDSGHNCHCNAAPVQQRCIRSESQACASRTSDATTNPNFSRPRFRKNKVLSRRPFLPQVSPTRDDTAAVSSVASKLRSQITISPSSTSPRCPVRTSTRAS